jgi:hypothetical protein
VGGERGESFWVHKDLISSRSDFFANALKREWMKVKDRKIELPDDEPKIFALYLQLLYTDKLPVKEIESLRKSGDSGDSSDNDDSEYWKLKDAECLELCQLYILADELQDVTSTNTVIDAILGVFKEMVDMDDGDLGPFLDFEVIKLVYDSTPMLSPLRQLMADHWVHRANKFWLGDEDRDALPEDFLFDVLRGTLDKREVSNRLKLRRMRGFDYYEKPKKQGSN